VRIVLREASDAKKPVKHAGFFVAINGSKLGPREFAIRTQSGFINIDVERAVHRADVVIRLIDFHRRVHTLGIEIEMAGRFPQVGFADVRGVQNFVAIAEMLLAPKFFDDRTNTSAFWMPVNQTGADFVVNAE